MKGTAGKEAGMPHKGKSTGKGKKAEESGRKWSSAPYKGKGAARRVEKEFMENIEKESEMVLWTNSTTRCGVMGVGMAQSRGRRHIFEMPKIWQRRMLCRR